MTTDYSYLDGKRVRLISMQDPYDPVPSGSEGTVICTYYDYYNKHLHISVNWDNGRGLNIVSPPDKYQVIN